MFGSEQRDQLDVRMLSQQIHGGFQFRIDAGRIGDQSDALSLDPIPVGLFKETIDSHSNRASGLK
jgi:hypothetical protein